MARKSDSRQDAIKYAYLTMAADGFVPIGSPEESDGWLIVRFGDPLTDPEAKKHSVNVLIKLDELGTQDTPASLERALSNAKKTLSASVLADRFDAGLKFLDKNGDPEHFEAARNLYKAMGGAA